MNQPRIHTAINRWLYQGRFLAAGLALLFVGYAFVYLWVYFPAGGPVMCWCLDSQLIVDDAQYNQADTPLQNGDRVLAIEGQTVRRMSPHYSPPRQESYVFLVERDGEELSLIVPVVGELNWRVAWIIAPASFLALVNWLVGSLMLYFIRRDNWQALHVGYAFLLSGVVLIGIQSALAEAPGAWIAGHVLIYPLAVAWVHLGFLPRSDPLPARVWRTLAWLLVVAGGLGLTAVYEVLVLFPQPTSFAELSGVSLYRLSFLLVALSLILCMGIQLWRVRHLRDNSYLRQQIRILLFFFSLGVLPTMGLTIIPRALFGVYLLPFPVAIGLMVLIPIGYLFVIYRKGFLGLDLFFSRALHLLALALLLGGLYTLGLSAWQTWVGPETGFAPGPWLLLLLLFLGLYADQPLNRWLQRLLYGRIVDEQEQLSRYAEELATHPGFATVEKVTRSIVGLMGSSQVLLLLRDDRGRLREVVGGGRASAADLAQIVLPELTKPQLRAAIQSELPIPLQRFTWAELIVPILVRGETVGLLALSRPNVNGYYTLAQVSFVERAAAILAVASENSYLFEATRSLGRRMMVVREEERQRIFADIHDEPLQRLFFVTHLLDLVNAEEEGAIDERVQEYLTRAWEETVITGEMLRAVCQVINPSMAAERLSVGVKGVVDRFNETHSLPLRVRIEEDQAAVAPEQVATICRIVSESLHNVVKHAQAESASVSVAWEDGMLLIEVADDGQGAPAIGLTLNDLIRRGNFGILGMHDWAGHMGGELRLLANQPRGTRVILRCPVQVRANGEARALWE